LAFLRELKHPSNRERYLPEIDSQLLWVSRNPERGPFARETRRVAIVVDGLIDLRMEADRGDFAKDRVGR